MPQTGMPGFIHKFHLQNIYIITIFSLIAYSSWMLPLCLAQMRIVFTVGSCSLWCPVIKIILSPTTHICQSGSLQDKPLRYRICFLQASPLTRFLGSNTHVIFAVLSLFFVWSKDLNRLGPNRSTLPRSLCGRRFDARLSPSISQEFLGPNFPTFMQVQNTKPIF